LELSAQQDLLPIVVIVLMLAIGGELELRHFAELIKQPKIPLLGTLVHTLTFPLVAVVLVLAVLHLGIDVSHASLIGILLIAACPSGGFSNVLVLVAGANLPLSVVLTAVSSLLSFFTVPVLFWLFGVLTPLVSGKVSLPVAETLAYLFVLITLPIGVGMLCRHFWTSFVAQNTARVQKYGQRALYVVLALTLFQEWDILRAGIEEALPWSILLCVATLSIGFFLPRLLGFSGDDSATVAIESSIRNLAVALLIAANVMNRIDVAALPTVYMIAVLTVGLGFSVLWRRRADSQAN
jgi:BASS family bile acid:Na+ symporter